MAGTNWKEDFLNSNGKMENGSQEEENLFFEKIAIQIREVVNHFKEDNSGTPRKANHAKGLVGFRNAKLIIQPDITLLNHIHPGFFTPGKEYENVIVRFSNASAEISLNDDSVPDLRGVAFRVMANDIVHDFLMTNAEIHHAKDAREAMIAIRSGVKKDIVEDLLPGKLSAATRRGIAGATGALPFLVTHLGRTGIHILTTLKKQMEQKVQSLSTETFWSRAPIAIGNLQNANGAIAVKYRLRPAKPKPEQNKISEGTKDLAGKLMDELKNEDIKFHFEVQPYKNPDDTPIEDATKSWGDDSTFIKIAELIIEKKSKNEIDAIDDLAFNPWNTDLNHFRPLGSMNRCRKKVYAAGVHERQIEAK